MKRFPIMEGPSIPWEMIEPYERQALKNHDQTLKRLAERGGLSPAEAVCIMRGLGHRAVIEMGDERALAELREMLGAWNDNVLRRERDEARQALEQALDILETLPAVSGGRSENEWDERRLRLLYRCDRRSAEDLIADGIHPESPGAVCREKAGTRDG